MGQKRVKKSKTVVSDLVFLTYHVSIEVKNEDFFHFVFDLGPSRSKTHSFLTSSRLQVKNERLQYSSTMVKNFDPDLMKHFREMVGQKRFWSITAVKNCF